MQPAQCFGGHSAEGMHTMTAEAAGLPAMLWAVLPQSPEPIGEQAEGTPRAPPD